MRCAGGGREKISTEWIARSWARERDMFEPRRRPGFFSSMLFIALMSGPPRFRSRDQFASVMGQVDWSVMLSIAIYGIALLWLGHKVASLLLRRARRSGVTTSHVLAMACVRLATLCPSHSSAM